jgi:hypothetical protein
MLPFGRFPLPKGSTVVTTVGGPIRASPDQRLHAPTRSLSQLATPFLGAQAKPSFKWRSMPNIEANTQQVLRPMRGRHHDLRFTPTLHF